MNDDDDDGGGVGVGGGGNVSLHVRMQVMSRLELPRAHDRAYMPIGPHKHPNRHGQRA